MVPCLQITLIEFSNDNKIYSLLEYPCSSVPASFIIDLKYMLKSVNTMVGEFIEFVEIVMEIL